MWALEMPKLNINESTFLCCCARSDIVKSRNTCFTAPSQPPSILEVNQCPPAPGCRTTLLHRRGHGVFHGGNKDTPRNFTRDFGNSSFESDVQNFRSKRETLCTYTVTKSCKIFTAHRNRRTEKGHDARGLLAAFRLNALTRMQCQNPGFLRPFPGSEKGVI